MIIRNVIPWSFAVVCLTFAIVSYRNRSTSLIDRGHLVAEIRRCHEEIDRLEHFAEGWRKLANERSAKIGVLQDRIDELWAALERAAKAVSH